MKKSSILLILTFILTCSFSTSQSAPLCQKELPTQNEMLKKLQELSLQSPQKNYGVGGLFLKEENIKLINAYRSLVTYKNTKLHPVIDIDYYSHFKNSSCDKTLCAAQSLFGHELGLVYLYYSAFYGINLSSLGYDRLKSPDSKYDLEFKAWYTVTPWKSLEEMTPMLQAIVNLPKKIIMLPNTRMLRSGISHPIKGSIIANGMITFYSPFDQLSEIEKETVTYHELGHAVGTVDQLDISNEWLEAAGWQVQGNQVVNLRPEEILSEYANYKSDSFEDFAETFMYYRYHSKRLQKKSPRRYEYMKKYVYGGQEYIEDKDCHNQNL